MSLASSGMDTAPPVKHRRTRSGCFTCRNRRVKCDETRPICDRCRKGGRDCEFPPPSSKRARLSDMKTTDAPSPLTDNDQKLSPIPDHSPTNDSDNLTEQSSARRGSIMSTLTRTRSCDPRRRRRGTRQISDASTSTSAENTTPASNSPHDDEDPPAATINSSQEELVAEWRRQCPTLDAKMEQYLLFHYEHMTHYHYMFKLDPEDFIHEELIRLAFQYEPLLYAILGFAAYHHALRLPDVQASFRAFWGYYAQSIELLRRVLQQKHDQHDLALLTMLQLATFEEYMGDWTGLMVHHRGAHSILVEIYTPQNVMATNRSRTIFNWYSRFDVIASLAAVQNAVLDRKWLVHASSWYEARKKDSLKGDLTDVMLSFGSILRLVGFDIAHLFASANDAQVRLEGSQELAPFFDRLLTKVNELTHVLDELRKDIEALHQPFTPDVELPTSAVAEDDVFDGNIPLFKGKLWHLNFVWLDWYGVSLMLKYQTLLAQHKFHANTSPQSARMQHISEQPTLPPEFQKYAEIQCQIYEAVERSTHAPEGAILGCNSSLRFASLFLPRAPPESNLKYTMWSRKKLATVERMGYVYPPHFRQQMAQLWALPEVEDWWLPNNEGKLAILDQIRSVVQERHEQALQQIQQTGRDDGRTDLRELKGIFEKLNISALHD
ncbi:hypothetical protein LTR66_015091 [Elasticomyces elasticus]|nr:hypothetical protein LTR66_015091 [Elasticomyces elasticus]